VPFESINYDISYLLLNDFLLALLLCANLDISLNRQKKITFFFCKTPRRDVLYPHY